jgi:hypothetical protein
MARRVWLPCLPGRMSSIRAPLGRTSNDGDGDGDMLFRQLVDRETLAGVFGVVAPNHPADIRLRGAKEASTPNSSTWMMTHTSRSTHVNQRPKGKFRHRTARPYRGETALLYGAGVLTAD